MVSDDPTEIIDRLEHVEDAFGGYTTGRPIYEQYLDPEESNSAVIQLRKACPVLDACRLLQKHGGFHTSVIEMSFAAIERTLEFYALVASNDSVNDFREGHERAYDRAAELGILSSEISGRLKDIFSENRSASYYRDTISTSAQADSLFDLSVAIHDYVVQFAQFSHECRCQQWSPQQP